MAHRSIPEWLRHAPAPSVQGFAVIAAWEAVARGILISVYPLAVYQALGDAKVVSAVYFAVGLLSFAAGLSVPWLNRRIPRRWLFAGSNLLYVLGALAGSQGGPLVVVGLVATTIATAATFVSFNAYVLDYIARVELGRCETLRMFYSAAGWTAGPVLGVWLMTWWAPAPFLVAATASTAMLVTFLVMRLGNGKLITRARRPAASVVGFLPRFFAQPRLVVGYSFALVRSCGWWVFVVYLPIFAVQQGLGERIGGTALSMANATLFLTPFMLRWIQRRSVRIAVRTGFLMAGMCFVASAALSGWPMVAIGAMATGAFFLVLLDVCGGLPFLMAVKPSERTEMSAVYASYRDVSGILTPGIAGAVLTVAPLASVFAVCGAALVGMSALGAKLHPRLGQRRVGAAG